MGTQKFEYWVVDEVAKRRHRILFDIEMATRKVGLRLGKDIFGGAKLLLGEFPVGTIGGFDDLNRAIE